MKRKITILLLLIAVIYIALSGLMYTFQNRFTFAPEVAALRQPDVFPSKVFKKVHLTTKDGTTLQGLQTHPLKNAPIVVFFGGNAQNLIHFAQFLRTALPGVNLVGFNYRGYGESAGTPTKKHLMLDVHAVAKYVRDKMPEQPIYSLGLSIGTGPATKYAALANTAGLLLIMPYDNLTEVARDLYPFLPVSLLLRNNIKTDAYIKKYNGPTAIIAAADDKIIRPERSKALAQHARNLITYQKTPGKTHISMIGSNELRGWLTAIFNRMSE